MSSYQFQNLYDYTPDLGFNISGTVLFGLIFGAFAFWFVKYPRTRWIQALACLTAISEMIVYALRSASNTDPYAESLWVAQYILGLFSPMWLIIGMLLALNKSYESNSAGAAAVFNRPKLFTMFLVGYQATVGLIILVGACFVGINRTVPGAYDYANNSGIYVLLTGLGNQVGVLTLVQGLLVWTLIRIRRDNSTGPTASDSSRCTAETSIKTFKIFIERLFLTFGMLWVRAIFRLCEQASPFNTIPQNSECYYALFDWAQVLVASLVWAVWPFAKGCDVDVGKDRELLADGAARMEVGKGDRLSMDSGSRLTV